MMYGVPKLVLPEDPSPIQRQQSGKRPWTAEFSLADKVLERRRTRDVCPLSMTLSGPRGRQTASQASRV